MEIIPNKTHVVSTMELCLWNESQKEDQIIPEGTPGLVHQIGNWDDIIVVDFDGFFRAEVFIDEILIALEA